MTLVFMMVQLDQFLLMLKQKRNIEFEHIGGTESHSEEEKSLKMMVEVISVMTEWLCKKFTQQSLRWDV